MKAERWLSQLLEKYKDDLEFRMEGLILDFTEKIVIKMQELNINRAELAKRLGVSKAFVTKLLNGNPNLTIKTMMSIADVLNCDLNLDLYPKGFEIKSFYVSPAVRKDVKKSKANKAVASKKKAGKK
jgi:transcriptional regulator with XRE-family HTH domain